MPIVGGRASCHGWCCKAWLPTPFAAQALMLGCCSLLLCQAGRAPWRLMPLQPQLKCEAMLPCESPPAHRGCDEK